MRSEVDDPSGAGGFGVEVVEVDDRVPASGEFEEEAAVVLHAGVGVEGFVGVHRGDAGVGLAGTAVLAPAAQHLRAIGLVAGKLFGERLPSAGDSLVCADATDLLSGFVALDRVESQTRLRHPEIALQTIQGGRLDRDHLQGGQSAGSRGECGYGPYSFLLLILFQSSLFLWGQLGLFLMLPFAFIFTSFITHICFSVSDRKLYSAWSIGRGPGGGY